MTSVLFYVLGVAAVLCGLAMVLARNPVYGAVFLIGCMIAIAGEFLVLDAPLLAALQVLVYTGAIMVLYLFVIMLLNLGRDPGFTWWKSWRTYTAFALTSGLVYVLVQSAWRIIGRGAGFGDSQVTRIGRLLWGHPTYLFLVETLAVLLLAAVIGAVYLGRGLSEREEAEIAKETSPSDLPEGAA